MKYCAFLIIASLLLFVSCSDNSPTQNVLSNANYSGNWQAYKGTNIFYDSLGLVISMDSIIYNDSFTMNGETLDWIINLSGNQYCEFMFPYYDSVYYTSCSNLLVFGDSLYADIFDTLNNNYFDYYYLKLVNNELKYVLGRYLDSAGIMQTGAYKIEGVVGFRKYTGTIPFSYWPTSFESLFNYYNASG